MMRHLKFESKTLILVSLSQLSFNLYEENYSLSLTENGNLQNKNPIKLFLNEWHWASPKSYAQGTEKLQSVRNYYNELPEMGDSL